MKLSSAIAMAALLSSLVLVALFGANTTINFVVSALIVALAAQGWNILGGFCGQFSFGHAAFFGTGAYVTAVLQSRYGVNAWVGFAAGILAGAAIGWIIGFLSFRAGLRGSYFALITLAFAEVLRISANAAAITGGGTGLLLKLDVRTANFQFASRGVFCLVALACVLAALALSVWITRTRLGAQFAAVRENEDAARALGIDVLATKLRAIALSGAVTAAAGCLYAQYFLYLDSGIAYGSWISVESLLAVIVGGIATPAGPIIGALALHALGEATRLLAGRITGVDLVLFGVILVLATAYAPSGIAGSWKSLAARLRRVRA